MNRELKVLVIEDDAATRLKIIENLIGAKMRVWEAENAFQGFSRAIEMDVIILDTTLPDHDGFTVIERLRGHNSLIPVIILTDDASVESKVRALDLGADDYMTKPFHKDELVARIKAVVRARSYGENEAARKMNKLVTALAQAEPGEPVASL